MTARVQSPSPQKILVAPAWPYASAPRHIGHVAGFAVPADIFARYHRLRGNDVLMVSGTDEHGTPVMVTADKEGRSPREAADEYSALIRDDLRDLGITYDCFTRTTTRNHYRVVQDLFRTLYDHGFVVERTTLGAFSPTTGHTLPDRYIEGTCPICGYAAGPRRPVRQLREPARPDRSGRTRARGSTGRRPSSARRSTSSSTCPRSPTACASGSRRQTHWRPNVRNFSLALVDDLKQRPITRDLDWGVPIPVEGYEESTNKRIYVWFDAVIGYLSAAVEWAHNQGRPDAWREWWQNPESRHFYFQGKDNIVFHTVIWPSMLLGYGEGGELGAGRGPLQLPYDVVASEFLTMEGRKFAASRGVGISSGTSSSATSRTPCATT